MFSIGKWAPGPAGALALILSGVLGLGPAIARAAEDQNADKTAPRANAKANAGARAHDPAARALLDRVAQAYRGLTSYSDQGEFVLAVTLDGKPQKQAQPLKLALARPNKFALDAGAVRLASDGKTLTTVVGPLKKYTTAPAPASLQLETFRAGPTGAVLFGGPTALPMVVLLNLITGSGPDALIDQIGGTIQPAPAAPGRKPASALLIAMKQGPNVLLEVDPKTTLLSAIELQIGPDELARATPPGQKLTVQRFGWRAGAISTEAGPPRAFALEAPQGFAKVDSFQGPAGDEPEFAVQKLVDKPAPDFSLTLLDGKDKTRTVTRAELAGKVVVIDFWATWCGPCLKELPEIQKLIESYAKAKTNQNVLIVALSQDNEPEELSEVRALVEKTLKAKSIDLGGGPTGRIGLDPSGSVGKAFAVEGFPTLVIIDGKGAVRSAHVGFDPEAAEPLHKVLGREIDALLEGKPLPASKGQGQGSEKPEKPATP